MLPPPASARFTVLFSRGQLRRRNFAFKRLLEPALEWQICTIVAGAIFCLLFTSALALNFPQLFVYVQICVFVVESGSLPREFLYGLHPPSARAADFWLSGLCIFALGLYAASAPRKIASLVLLRQARDTYTLQRLSGLAFFLIGLQWIFVGLALCWTGAQVPSLSGDELERHQDTPDYLTTPHLPRLLLICVWFITLALIRFLLEYHEQWCLSRSPLRVGLVAAFGFALCSIVTGLSDAGLM